MPNRPSSLTIVLVLIIGLLGVSNAAIFVRLGYAAGEGLPDVGLGLVMATLRLCFAGLLLAPLWYRTRNEDRPQTGAYWYVFGAGVFLAVHFASWIPAFAFTSIAASTTIATSSPIWVALILWLWRGETPGRLAMAGIGLQIDVRAMRGSSGPALLLAAAGFALLLALSAVYVAAAGA